MLERVTGKPPRVSIVIPVFNGGNYLGDAIDSALSQTYKDCEVIVVNDGSRDGGQTKRIAQSFGPHITYKEKANGGVSSALNFGIRHMTGDIFTWLSHDDVFETHKTALQVDAYRSAGRRNLCLFSDFTWIDSFGSFIGKQEYGDTLMRNKPASAFFECMINGCTTFIPRCVFDEVGLFDEKALYTQDYWMWRNIERRFGFVHLPYCLTRVRKHAEQDSMKPAALAEAEMLWTAILDQSTCVERSYISGSSERFFAHMGRFLLERSPVRAAAHRAFSLASEARVHRCASAVLISDGASDEEISRSLESILCQGRHLAEIVVAGSEAVGAVGRLLRGNAEGCPVPVRFVCGKSGVAGGWYDGLIVAKSDYIALLRAPDVWLPGKLAAQVDDLAERGWLISHTSYGLRDNADPSRMRIGSFAGNVYPEIIGFPHIAPSTLMIHRSLVAHGWTFDGNPHLQVVGIAARHRLAGIPEVYATVRAADPVSAEEALRTLLTDPEHGRHSRELRRLGEITDRRQRIHDEVDA